MDELEITQPEEQVEGAESTERVEEQALQEAAAEPGARVEETQTFEQAEAVEAALTEAVDTAEQVEVTPVPIPTPEPAEDDDDMQLISGPDRKDLPDGTGILEEPHETVEMADKPEDRGIADVAEVPEGIEFELAGDADEAGTVDRDDHPMADPSELSETTDDDKDEVTPINLPGPVAAVAEEPEPGPSPYSPPALENSGPGGRVAQDPVPDPQPDFNVALDQPGTDGNVAEMPDPSGHPPGPNLELSPDDVKQEETLQPAPDFEAMSPAEESVVDIIGNAIADEDYRGVLFSDVETAARGYEISDQDQNALGEMTAESFDFFAAEVEKRINEALAGFPESDIIEAKQQILKQTVHAVWRDLNPGGLAYVLAYKIPQKHL